ncbi:hypothetical protein QUC31_005660 [Theobroma cacao]
MNEAEKVVCVTGASGYVASWLVKLLLQRGYTVKATVRDPSQLHSSFLPLFFLLLYLFVSVHFYIKNAMSEHATDDPKKTEHLLSLDGAKERLHLFKAELMDEGCFDSVVDGCQGVFHTASPVFISAADPQAEIIDPAVKGTLNVLKSCAKVPSIKRVVITSSLASVIYNGKPLTPDVVVDETWFSDPRLSEENKEWYTLSKTLAEEAAWRFAKENGIDLVSINPGLVLGPLLQPALNSSPLVILHLAKGEHIFPTSSYYRVVDVRDVAYAHIQAFEVPSASGRYCLVERVIQFPEVQKILCEIYPTNLHFKAKYEDYHNKPLESTYLISKEKAKGLGVSFNPFEMIRRRQNTCLRLMEPRKDFICSKQSWSMKDAKACEDLNKPLERTYRLSKEKAKSLGVSFIPLEGHVISMYWNWNYLKYFLPP